MPLVSPRGWESAPGESRLRLGGQEMGATADSRREMGVTASQSLPSPISRLPSPGCSLPALCRRLCGLPGPGKMFSSHPHQTTEEHTERNQHAKRGDERRDHVHEVAPRLLQRLTNRIPTDRADDWRGL